MTEEGTGSCDGVSYAYSLTNNAWFGCYECRVHKFFFDAAAKRFSTEPFDIGGYKWQLRLLLREDGYLSVFLVPRNLLSVNLHYGVTLVHQTDEKQSQTKGWSGVFKPDMIRGYSQFCRTDDIKTVDQGFLSGDSFAIRVEIRLKLLENENFSVALHGQSCTCTWKLRHIMDMSPESLSSDLFSIQNSKWHLRLTLGKDSAGKQQSAFYLYSLNSETIRVKCVVHAFHYPTQAAGSSQELICDFHGEHTYWGLRPFLDTTLMENPIRGYLEDGWFTLVAQIAIEEDEETSDTSSQFELSDIEAEHLDIWERPCVVCLSKKQTSGFVHNKTSHRCVCASCCELLFQKKFNCPICCAKIDSIVLKYF